METQSTQPTWRIDPEHSVIEFRIKHLAISTISGTFRSFKGEVYCTTEDMDNSEVYFEIDASSIDTNHQIRDGHLKGEDFLEIERYPKIIFKGQLKKTLTRYSLIGELMLHGTAKQFEFQTEATGSGKGRNGDIRRGFEIEGKINRKDFGLSFNMLTETGGLIVGEEIKLKLDIQIIKQQ
ncbi:MAG: polyisoprenoid-binding protein [Chryseobacterium sp.]|nr:MAG: polyisoprenoid-binding protein [Chryseobacterium sp.]